MKRNPPRRHTALEVARVERAKTYEALENDATVDLVLVSSPPTMLSEYPTALPTPCPTALPTPSPQAPSAPPSITPVPTTARPTTNDSRIWIFDDDDETTIEEYAAALGIGSLVGGAVALGLISLARKWGSSIAQLIIPVDDDGDVVLSMI